MSETLPLLQLIDARPPDVGVDYLKSLRYPILLRNTATIPLLIEEIVLTFETDYEGLPADALEQRFPWHQILKPDQHDHLSVSIIPSLVLRSSSNVFRVAVKLRRNTGTGFGKDELVPVAGDGGNYIVIHDRPLVDQVFISFKDPEDEYLSHELAKMARHAGITGYRAKDHPEPGITDYWEQKIRPAIKNSFRTVVIWTTSAAGDADRVRREIRMSQDEQIPVVLFCEKGLQPPEECPASHVEHVPFAKPLVWTEFARVLTSLANRKR